MKTMKTWKHLFVGPVVAAAVALSAASCAKQDDARQSGSDASSQNTGKQGGHGHDAHSHSAGNSTNHTHTQGNAAQGSASGGAAAHDHGAGHGTGHGSGSQAGHAEVQPPTTYADAVKRIQSHVASIDAIVKSGEYAAVHNDSEAIRTLCAGIGSLASARNSGVPPERVQEVTAWANELSTASRVLHSAAHDDDLTRVQEQYARMTRLLGSLQGFAR